MDLLEYNGKQYKRYNDKWADLTGLIVHDSLQKELNSKFAETLDLQSLDIQEIVAQGDKFNKSASYGLALRFYEHAAKDADEETLSYILPRMTSCYRKQRQPQKAIDILSFAKDKYGQEMITPPLLTSAAAAYCDLKEFAFAKKYCDRAYAALNGRASEELRAVYARLHKESNGLY